MRYMPIIAELVLQLREVRNDAREWTDIEDGIDVRLQVVPGEGWSLHTGDPSYDIDHRGYWGTTVVSGEDSEVSLRECARELIEEVRDAIAEGGWES